MLRAVSNGAGVQSTTILLMAAHGEITPMPDCSIFADTQAEGEKVYEHLRWLISPNVLPFPTHIVTAGNIVDNMRGIREGKRWASIPAFVLGEDGRPAILTRQCTTEFKIEPIHKKIRELLGLVPGQSFRHFLGIGPRDPVPILVEQWIGISRDEAHRQKPSEHEWIQNRYPLIELEMTRQDCERWLLAHEYPVPAKSACVFCPFMENARWRERRSNQRDWALVQEVDQIIADGAPTTETRVGTKPMYLHRSLRRADEVDLTDLFDTGFDNECGGNCGV